MYTATSPPAPIPRAAHLLTFLPPMLTVSAIRSSPRSSQAPRCPAGLDGRRWRWRLVGDVPGAAHGQRRVGGQRRAVEDARGAVGAVVRRRPACEPHGGGTLGGRRPEEPEPAGRIAAAEPFGGTAGRRVEPPPLGVDLL